MFGQNLSRRNQAHGCYTHRSLLWKSVPTMDLFLGLWRAYVWGQNFCLLAKYVSCGHMSKYATVSALMLRTQVSFAAKTPTYWSLLDIICVVRSHVEIRVTVSALMLRAQVSFVVKRPTYWSLLWQRDLHIGLFCGKETYILVSFVAKRPTYWSLLDIMFHDIQRWGWRCAHKSLLWENVSTGDVLYVYRSLLEREELACHEIVSFATNMSNWVRGEVVHTGLICGKMCPRERFYIWIPSRARGTCLSGESLFCDKHVQLKTN